MNRITLSMLTLALATGNAAQRVGWQSLVSLLAFVGTTGTTQNPSETK